MGWVPTLPWIFFLNIGRLHREGPLIMQKTDKNLRYNYAVDRLRQLFLLNLLCFMTFFLSKFLWIFINPFSVFFFFLFISILLLLFRYNKTSTYVLIINFIFLSIIAIFPIGKVAIQLLERNYYGEINYPKNIDGILILAGATNPYLSKEYDSINLNSSAERLIESVFLIKKYKNANVIFSGGSGSLSNSDLSHAKVAKKFWQKKRRQKII